MSERCTLTITGMHCASCSALITRTLKKTPGVQDANVNLATAKATVTYDPASVNEEGLVHAVHAAGYGAQVNDPQLLHCAKLGLILSSSSMTENTVNWCCGGFCSCLNCGRMHLHFTRCFVPVGIR
jgi:Cu+-exporting ATPase